MPVVSWEQMREHFRRERKRRGLTQKDVAAKGGLDQGTVSKIEGTDPKYAPKVDTFVDAIHGLGMTAAEFLAPLEGLKILREGGKTTLLIPADESSAPVPRAADDTVEEFVLDLIEHLQDFAAARHARKHGERPRKPPQRRAPTPSSQAHEDSRTGTKR